MGADGEVSSYAPIAGLTRGARADEILTGYSRLTGAPHRKVFAGETLAYVTPWNSGGYNVAKQHAGKFDFLSPVWLQVREDEGSPEGIKITGLHDIDRGWIADVRANCSTVEGAKVRAPAGCASRVMHDDARGAVCAAQRIAAPHRRSQPLPPLAAARSVQCPLIVPRIVWEARRGGPNVLQRAVTIIKNVVRDNTFDGVTLEAPPTPTFIPFIEALGKALHGMKPTRGMKARADAFRADHDDDGDDGGASGGAGASSYGRALVLVLPPNVAGAEDRASATGSGANAVIHEQLVSLARFVDRFSVMTYDHSVHRGASSGPNAPLRWVRETVQAMLGGGGGAGSSAAAAGAAADPARQRLAKKILMGLPFYG